jgi:hypothetical protein
LAKLYMGLIARGRAERQTRFDGLPGGAVRC